MYFAFHCQVKILNSSCRQLTTCKTSLLNLPLFQLRHPSTCNNYNYMSNKKYFGLKAHMNERVNLCQPRGFYHDDETWIYIAHRHKISNALMQIPMQYGTGYWILHQYMTVTCLCVNPGTVCQYFILVYNQPHRTAQPPTLNEMWPIDSGMLCCWQGGRWSGVAPTGLVSRILWYMQLWAEWPQKGSGSPACTSVGESRPFLWVFILRQSRPNKAVHTYARLSTKSFFDFNDILRVDRGQWVLHYGMQYDPIQGQGHKPSKLEIRHFLKAKCPLPFTKGASNSPRILKLRHSI